jgi:hypothetical protein
LPAPVALRLAERCLRVVASLQRHVNAALADYPR